MIWTPRTVQELETAIDNGLLDESHVLDLKRELPAGTAANKDFAKDVAAFSVDGGTILIGIDEGPPVALSPVELDGLPERVELIAKTRVDEGVHITTTTIEVPAGSGRGVLVISVPASPRAPHMADGRYYGRGDKTNYPMSHAEVLRRHEQQVSQREDILSELRKRRDSLNEGVIMAADHGVMMLLAKPLGARPDMLKPLTSSGNWQSVMVETVRAAGVPARMQQFIPNVYDTPRQARRPRGVALTTGADGKVFKGGSREAELVALESGELLLLSGRTILDGPAGKADRRIFEDLIVGNVELLVRFAALVSELYEFVGSWQFGLLVTGLEGGCSNTLRSNLAYPYTATYSEDTFEATAVGTLAEIETQPEAVVEALVGALLRSLGSLHAFDWLPQ